MPYRKIFGDVSQSTHDRIVVLVIGACIVWVSIGIGFYIYLLATAQAPLSLFLNFIGQVLTVLGLWIVRSLANRNAANVQEVREELHNGLGDKIAQKAADKVATEVREVQQATAENVAEKVAERLANGGTNNAAPGSPAV